MLLHIYLNLHSYVYSMHLGQQCCYDTNGKYMRTPRPAGSADYYHVKYSYLKHQQSDYFPYIACCFDAKNLESGDVEYCKEYYKKRPSDNSTSCVNTKTKSGRYISTCMYFHG